MRSKVIRIPSWFWLKMVHLSIGGITLSIGGCLAGLFWNRVDILLYSGAITYGCFLSTEFFLSKLETPAK